MSSFTTPLSVTPCSDGKNWRLNHPFTYHVGSKTSMVTVSVPKDFETDFASVPRIFWFLPDWAVYSKAPVLHDWLYHSKKIMGKRISRKTADLIFLEAMHVDWRYHKSRKFVAHLEYLAVRWFAWLAWKNKGV